VVDAPNPTLADSPGGTIEGLLAQSAALLAGASGTPSAEHLAAATQTLHTISQVGDQVSLGLFPLALALLILHENFQAATGEGRFRVAHVLGRAAVVAALVHPWGYGRLCGLITYAAGGHGGFLASEPLLSMVGRSVDGLGRAFTDLAGEDPGIVDAVTALLRLLPLIGLWLVLVTCLLLAYVAGLLLSLSQAILLALLLGVGKTCLVASLVPGVGLGASWARSLAKVAAWSTVAAVVTGLMTHAMPDLRSLVAMMSYVQILRTAGQFVVLAFMTFSVPILTEKIFSGAAPAGSAALAALGKGWQGLRAAGSAVSAGAARPGSSSERSARGRSPQGGPEGGGGSVRPHKTAPSHLRSGLAFAGTVAGAAALAPVALAAGLLRRKRASTPEPQGAPAEDRPRDDAGRAQPNETGPGEARRPPVASARLATHASSDPEGPAGGATPDVEGRVALASSPRAFRRPEEANDGRGAELAADPGPRTPRADSPAAPASCQPAVPGPATRAASPASPSGAPPAPPRSAAFPAEGPRQAHGAAAPTPERAAGLPRGSTNPGRSDGPASMTRATRTALPATMRPLDAGGSPRPHTAASAVPERAPRLRPQKPPEEPPPSVRKER
jgi:hypothetical protein